MKRPLSSDEKPVVTAVIDRADASSWIFACIRTERTGGMICSPSGRIFSRGWKISRPTSILE
eukprot:COSAG02_NODE_4509_length_5280_cov_2.005790_8_plen_62_part_00